MKLTPAALKGPRRKDLKANRKTLRPSLPLRVFA